MKKTDTGLKGLVPAAVITMALAVLDVVAIIVLSEFKVSITTANDTTVNDTIDSFVTGLTIFASFIGIVIIAIVGKVLIAMFKK